MANTIITKNDSTGANVPAAGEMVEGELAINVTDKILYSKTSSTVFQVFDGVYAPIASPTFTGTVTSPNYNATTIASAYQIAGDTAISEVSNWLYVNGTNVFTSGVYCGNTILRTDGQLQVGTSGAQFLVTAAGVVTAAGAITGSNLSGTNTGDNATNSQYSGLVSNATHTSEVTGSGALTVDPVAISNKTLVTAVATDMVLLWDAGDSLLKRANVSDFLGGSGTVTNVNDGNGMTFTAITGTGDVTMGTPGALTGSTSNGVTTDSHTHEITSITAAKILAGNLGSGVLPYCAISATASDFKIPFINHTSTFSGPYALLQDSAATFTYNPSTNTLFAANITGTNIGGITSTDLVDKSADEVITGAWSVPSEINGKTASYTMLLGDAGKTVRFTGATASKVCTIPANASVAYPIGTMIGVTNDGSVTMTLVITTDTMTWGKDNTTGTRTLAAGADCVIHKTTATTWKINGSALVT